MRVPGCSRLGSAELTCSWMRSLLGPSVKLVEKSTAHFSSVTDSVPFRSQRLIFFRSCQGEEVGGMRGKGVVGFLSGPPPSFPRRATQARRPLLCPRASHQVLEQG